MLYRLLAHGGITRAVAEEESIEVICGEVVIPRHHCDSQAQAHQAPPRSTEEKCEKNREKLEGSNNKNMNKYYKDLQNHLISLWFCAFLVMKEDHNGRCSPDDVVLHATIHSQDTHRSFELLFWHKEFLFLPGHFSHLRFANWQNPEQKNNKAIPPKDLSKGQTWPNQKIAQKFAS